MFESSSGFSCDAQKSTFRSVVLLREPLSSPRLAPVRVLAPVRASPSRRTRVLSLASLASSFPRQLLRLPSHPCPVSRVFTSRPHSASSATALGPCYPATRARVPALRSAFASRAPPAPRPALRLHPVPRSRPALRPHPIPRSRPAHCSCSALRSRRNAPPRAPPAPRPALCRTLGSQCSARVSLLCLPCRN